MIFFYCFLVLRRAALYARSGVWNNKFRIRKNMRSVFVEAEFVRAGDVSSL